MPAPADQPSVLIVGAGFGGIGMAVELKRAGLHDVTVLERADQLGGVWRDNTYPGAACDVPAPYYCYSFAPNRHWPVRFAEQRDILAYLTRVAYRYDVGRHLRFGSEVTAAEFDEPSGQWRVHTSAGTEYRATVLVFAVGQLSRPALPAIPGIERFPGPAFHSACWDHDVDLAGRRVAVVGTGASAVQFVPRIQPEVARLTLFQRTAPWVVPKPERRYRPGPRPAAALRSERLLFWTTGELATLGLTGNRAVGWAFATVARQHLRRQVPDLRLRAALTPDYRMGCKRVLLANDYYPALVQPNVRVRTEPISAVTPGGVRTADGVEHAAEVIIYATGFATGRFTGPIAVRGAGGRDLAAQWRAGARAYLGMAVPGFPNMFLLYGPNTNLGAGSIIYMLERQARYVRQAVQHLAVAPGSARIEVRAEVADRFDAELQRRLVRTAWTQCASWYRDASGRISTNWPGLVSEYHRRTRTYHPADYRLTGAEPGR